MNLVYVAMCGLLGHVANIQSHFHCLDVLNQLDVRTKHINNPSTTMLLFRLILTLWGALAFAHPDLYSALQVAPDAEKLDLKKAYRRLSLLYHPEPKMITSNDDAKFVEVAKAYEILSHDELRRVYDERGYDGLQDFYQHNDFEGHDKYDFLVDLPWYTGFPLLETIVAISIFSVLGMVVWKCRQHKNDCTRDPAKVD